jgi:hypothetical protein
MKIHPGFILLLSLGSIIGAVAVWENKFDKSLTVASPIVVSGWNRTDVKLPPVGEPFVGVWTTEGMVNCEFVIHYGFQYWEYAATLRPPIGACFGALPPAWWIDAPGGAE